MTPQLYLKLPRQVTAVHQIELTSRCSLRCVYCPSRDIADGKYSNRKAVDMSREHFEAALSWVSWFVKNKTQQELNLAGIGESLLHHHFVEFLGRAREVVGEEVKIIFATNGLECSDELVRAMVPYHPSVWVSLHRPERAGKAVEVYRKYGLLEGVSIDPTINGDDWAGQVSWHNAAHNRILCPWIREGRVMVMADGRVTTCCLDAAGAGVIGHITDPIMPEQLRTQPYQLCRTCNQEVGVSGYAQRA